MTQDASSSRALARALGARNAVAFDCVHARDECVRRLAAAVDDGDLLLELPGTRAADAAGDPLRPLGRVRPELVDLEWNGVRFRGEWKDGATGPKLEGTTSARGQGLALTLLLVPITLFAMMGMQMGGAWVVALPALFVMVMLPIVAGALGSKRIASEIALVRLIGTTIGDPGKYAARWHRWSDD